MSDKPTITVETTVEAPVHTVWDYWTGAEHVVHWNYALEEWHSPHATTDLREGGKFNYRMEAKDGSAGFDFEGTFTKIIPQKYLEFTFGDRTASVTFEEQDGQTRIIETFEVEEENSIDLQRQGWQAILDNFKNYAESHLNYGETMK